jgi:type VI secretion system protein ImpJ
VISIAANFCYAGGETLGSGSGPSELSVMTVRAVHWHEGMFLWPQQLQQGDRHSLDYAHRQHRWNVHYNWGLRSLEWDPEALRSSQFVVKGLQARLRDGTLITVPEDAALAPLDLKSAFDRESFVTLYLALPELHAGKANAIPRNEQTIPKEGEEPPPEVRYLVDAQDLEDENSGVDAQTIQVRFLNVKLLTSNQDLAGYEVLPLARVHRTGGQDAPCQLDETFIPPVLACDAWKPLKDGILQEIFDRFGRRVNLLSRQIVSRGISFDTHNPGDSLLLGQLHALNQGYALLNTMAFAEGVHPLPAYLELCRYAGQLAIFTTTRKAPDLPRYDHDDLGTCFYRVKQYLDSVDIQEPSYEERPFIGHGMRIEVTIEPKWLEPIWEMFVGVQSNLTQEECIRLLTRSGPLDMKIGSADRVDYIYDRGLMGLEFTASPKPPRALPVQAGLVYFQVLRTTKLEEWQNVQKSLTLAIRLNQNRIVGNIEGQHILTIRTGGEQKTMQFTLFLVPRETTV